MRGHEWPNVNLNSAVVAGEDTTIAVVPGGDTTVAVVAGEYTTVDVIAGGTLQ